MKIFLISFLILLNFCDQKSQNNFSFREKKEVAIQEINKIPKEKISEMKNFLKNKKYNKDLVIFINFKINSGKNRFFLYDLKGDKILEAGLVAHGSGSEVAGKSELQFSNIENSYQSSLGKYAIQNSYNGTFGKAYRLKGLEKSNSNAMKRSIVLHSYSSVPDAELETPIVRSLGCPMLSPNFFKTISKYLDQSKKPIIIDAYY
ncbi:L,D-transpeptidase catalytic domain [Halpernia humi]|uniref:L,D-transpeptidase catalytic domain n=1 Tax=Halpernia humi TaxID=493375 RepID=A0A1H5SX90_9FLAO|nr:L,D-transpeptidase catalytic domain [Halpernia humi]